MTSSDKRRPAELVSFEFPLRLVGRLREELLPSLSETIASPAEVALNLDTLDNVAMLVDMAAGLCLRARALLRSDTSDAGRTEIVKTTERAWKGVYGTDIHSLWKRKLLFAMEYVSRLVKVVETSGERALFEGDEAGRMVLEVLYPRMKGRFSPFVTELGQAVGAWRDREGGISTGDGKFKLLAALWARATDQKVNWTSLKRMYERVGEAEWQELHRAFEEGAGSSQCASGVRLEMAPRF